tara:strand:+ start:2132 stop:3139 length:1008 start_codon:yes stop_codon:yes gene_type:complete
MNNILITGGLGFIGSNFISFLLKKYSDKNIINLDSLTYAGNEQNLEKYHDDNRYTFIKGDICDRVLIEKVFNKYKIDGIIHFAAESHVDNSISHPDIFIKTNIIGTFNLLDVAFKNWMIGPNKKLDHYNDSRFHHISTDEVYGSLGDTGLFKETTPYAPNSPYSASKASSDMIVRSYHETYGMNTVITNCSNNYGPKQHKEKLIPKIIFNALNNLPIPIYGDGKNIRDWLYVQDHCMGIDLVFNHGINGEVYNIGGKNEKTNIEIVEIICDKLDKKIPKSSSYKNLIEFVEDRAGHDRRYAIDASKIEQNLNWKANENFDSGIDKTIDWYLNYYK